MRVGSSLPSHRSVLQHGRSQASPVQMRCCWQDKALDIVHGKAKHRCNHVSVVRFMQLHARPCRTADRMIEDVITSPDDFTPPEFQSAVSLNKEQSNGAGAQCSKVAATTPVWYLVHAQFTHGLEAMHCAYKGAACQHLRFSHAQHDPGDRQPSWLCCIQSVATARTCMQLAATCARSTP